MLAYVLTGFALSMDAFAVSVSAGICVADLKFRHAVRTALAFGFFQFLMPILGYFAAFRFAALIRSWDHWVAFILLSAIGGKMLYESTQIKDEAACTEDELARKNILSLRILLAMAVATSLDALAVGISYSLLQERILPAAGIIGIITFAVCLVGCEFGKRLGSRFERGAEVLGGLVLIGIGLRILITAA